MNVSTWQDVGMEQPIAQARPAGAAQSTGAAEPLAVRTVDDVDVLKAMADPTRMAILAALMRTRRDLPVMSVKELAAELGEPQTKLYRHVRQLEAAGLIRVASTRMVSGILEQRYQAGQPEPGPGPRDPPGAREETTGAMQAILDRFRDGFLAAFLARQRSPDDVLAAEDYRAPVLFMSDLGVFAGQGSGAEGKAKEIMDELNDEQTEDPDGVPVNLLIGCYVPAAGDTGRSDLAQAGTAYSRTWAARWCSRTPGQRRRARSGA